MKWWRKLWERERGAEPQPAAVPSEEPVPATPLWISPLEERIVVGVIWGN